MHNQSPSALEERRTATAPPQNRELSRKKRKRQRKGPDIQPKTQRNPRKTKTKTLIIRAQTNFIDTLSAASMELSKGNRKNLAKSYQELTSITLNLLEQNAYLKGKLTTQETQQLYNQDTHKNPERPIESTRSYAEVVNKSPKRKETEKEAEKVEHKKVENILVYSTQQYINPREKIKELLKQNFNPTELGLGQPSIRDIKNGVLITSTTSSGISNLKTAIEHNEKTRDILYTKDPQKRYPQFLISGVPRDTNQTELTRDIITHNHIQGDPEQIVVRQTFQERSGTSAIVVEVAPEIFQQMRELKKVHIGWSVCSLGENIHIPKCTYCSQYGHTRNTCRGHPVCGDCASREHTTEQCNATEYECNACLNYNTRTNKNDMYTDHPFGHSSCQTLEHLTKTAKSRICYT